MRQEISEAICIRFLYDMRSEICAVTFQEET
jgi:hypothetical protein